MTNIDVPDIGSQKWKWTIGIGGGFDKTSKHSYPINRLEKFLNAKLDTDKEVADFCTELKIIPERLSKPDKDLKTSFTKEQSSMREIATKASARTPLSKEDIDLINTKLGNIRKALFLASDSTLNRFNNAVSKGAPRFSKGDYFISTLSHANSTVSLWEDLAMAITKTDLNTCINCGGLFRPTSAHSRKYCSPNCGNDYRVNKSRMKKKRL